MAVPKLTDDEIVELRSILAIHRAELKRERQVKEQELASALRGYAANIKLYLMSAGGPRVVDVLRSQALELGLSPVQLAEAERQAVRSLESEHKISGVKLGARFFELANQLEMFPPSRGGPNSA